VQHRPRHIAAHQNKFLLSIKTNVIAEERAVLKDHMAGNVSNAKKPIDLFEVIQIRTHLLSSNCIKLLQRFVLILLCIRLFLRINEATGDRETEESSTKLYGIKEYEPTGITDKSFVLNAITIRNGEVLSMVIKVRGKTDSEIFS
jgi:hypothetical protein